jgi:hypothetical protein
LRLWISVAVERGHKIELTPVAAVGTNMRGGEEETARVVLHDVIMLGLTARLEAGSSGVLYWAASRSVGTEEALVCGGWRKE